MIYEVVNKGQVPDFSSSLSSRLNLLNRNLNYFELDNLSDSGLHAYAIKFLSSDENCLLVVHFKSNNAGNEFAPILFDAFKKPSCKIISNYSHLLLTKLSSSGKVNIFTDLQEFEREIINWITTD